MSRLRVVLALLTLGAVSAPALEKVAIVNEDVGHVAKESPLPNGGAARNMDEWKSLKPMLTDLTDFPVNFEQETALYCSMPSTFDGGSYPIRAETMYLEGGVLKVQCKAEWPDVFMSKTNTRRYHIVTVPRFDGPIEIAFTMIGPEFASFAPLFSTIHIPPLADYPIFGPADTR